MNIDYYAFYGKYAIGIFTDPVKLFRYRNSVELFRLEMFKDFKEAEKYVIDGYNKTRFISGRINDTCRIELNRVYQTKEMQRLGWI